MKYLILLTLISCSIDSEKKDIAIKNEEETTRVLEYIKSQEERFQKFRQLVGILELDTMMPQDIDDKYFRFVNYPPFNQPFEIIEVKNFYLERPTISKRTIHFDYQCNFVSGEKELGEDCFSTLDSITEYLSYMQVDSLFSLLDETEFWNLSRETYNVLEEVIFDGNSIEMAGYIAKRTHERDSLSKYQNLIERRISERYIGVSMISEYLHELLEE